MAGVPDAEVLEAYIRKAAAQRGIDPDLAVRVARGEGLKNGVWQAYGKNKQGQREPSYGPFQLKVGGPGTGFEAGLGYDMIQAKGLDPSDPANVYAGIDFALDTVKRDGWGRWNAARKMGITGKMGVDGRPMKTEVQPKPGEDAIAQAEAQAQTSAIPAKYPNPTTDYKATYGDQPSLAKPEPEEEKKGWMDIAGDLFSGFAKGFGTPQPQAARTPFPTLPTTMNSTQMSPTIDPQQADMQRQQLAMALQNLNTGRLWG